jgi:Na+-transporting NADH:ubiquinone oxidoreductase subunit NqrC
MHAKEFNTQYPTYQESQKNFFSSATAFVPSDIVLNDDEIDKVQEMSKVRVRDPKQKVWRVEQNGHTIGWFMIDRVIGKHELITYSLALSTDGKVKGIEILDFRESYGEQIHELQWRAQFIGKTLSDPFKLDQDIRNISGATLSCKNVTNGVKRLLATYTVKLK